MKKISTREYRKHYILNLLPSSKNDGALTYTANAAEVKVLDKWLNTMTRLLIKEPLLVQRITAHADQLKKIGGPLISVKPVYIPLHETSPAPLVFLDLSYSVTKEVQFVFGGIDVTLQVSKCDKLTGLLTRFMKDLYASHEHLFGDHIHDAFMEEMFLIDDIDMVIDENSQFKIKVDPSLRDYLVALNTRLRISA